MCFWTRTSGQIRLWSTHKLSEADHALIAAEIARAASHRINFPVDGGAGQGERGATTSRTEEFCDVGRTHVHYLPGAGSPEKFLWDHMQRALEDDALDDQPVKDRFEKITRREMNLAEFRPLTSVDIFSTQRRRLATIPEDHPDMTATANELLTIAGRLGNWSADTHADHTGVRLLLWMRRRYSQRVFLNAGLDVVFGMDIDPDAAATFKLNLPTVQFHTKVISEIYQRKLTPLIGTRNQPLLFSGCAPCQPDVL